MMEERAGIRAGRVCAAAAFTLLLVLFLAAGFDFYYDLNDDTAIKDILSGAYTGTPSGYCIQMLYPLAWVIALLYRAIPTVPWYGLFLCACQFGVFFLIAVRLVRMMKSTRACVAALVAELVFAAGLCLRELVIIQYSVTAAVCMAGAVCLFITAPQTEKASVFFRRNLLPLFLVVLSFMIRTEVCIMLLPFLLLAGISKWCGEQKFFTATNIKKYVMLIGTALLMMLAVYSLDMLAYRDSEWSRFRDFFDARTKLYDFYGFPDYEENQDFYESIGLSQESYTLLENYNFALDESIDVWRLESIIEYQKGRLHNTYGFVSKKSVQEAVWCYKEQFLNDIRAVRHLAAGESGNGFYARMAVLAAYVVYIAVCIVPTKGKARVGILLKMAGLIAIRSILWLYLYMVDRVLDRVTMPLLMLEFVTLIAFMLCDCVLRNKIANAIYAISIVCALVFVGGNLHNLQAEYAGRAAADERWNALMDYCRENGNNYYVIDVYSSTSYNGMPYSEKIFKDVDDSYKNFDICGGWAAKSPLARQKLEKYQFKDVQSALYNAKGSSKKRAYFVERVDKDLDWLVQYYGKRGFAIKPVRAAQIATASAEYAFDVYRMDEAAAVK